MEFNMKVLFVFSCFTVAALAQNPGTIADEQMLHHIHDACQADPATHADHALLDNLLQNIDNPQIGAHMLCEAKGVGLQTQSGELDFDTIREKIGLSVKDPKTVDFLVQECAVPKNSPEKTAVNLFMCLDRNNVTYFHAFIVEDEHDHDH